MSIIVLGSPRGFHLFFDPLMVFEDEAFEYHIDYFTKLKMVSEFLFNNASHAASVIDKIEHKYELPIDLKEYFQGILTLNGGKFAKSKWNFMSQVLGQLVSQAFGLKWYCFPMDAQRFLYSNLPAILNIDESIVDETAKDLACHLYNPDDIELRSYNEPDFEEEINEQEIEFLRKHEEEEDY